MNDTEIREQARNLLKGLGVWDQTPANKTTVDLHYENQTDSDLINDVEASLKKSNYVVHRIAPKGRKFDTGIKYFNVEDKQNAYNVQSLVQDLIRSKVPSFAIKVGYLRKYKRDIGTIELWIPSLEPPPPNPLP